MSLQTAEKQSTQLKQYLQVMAGLERLNLAQEKECLCKMASGDEDSRRRLVESYLPRVVAWAGEFRGGALRFEELIELGNQALVVAAWAASRREISSLEKDLQRAVLSELEEACGQSEKA